MTKNIRNYLWSSYQEYTDTPFITNTDLALDVFSRDRRTAIELFESYMNEKTADECLDYKEKVTLSDKEVIDYLRKNGIMTISELQAYKKEERDNIIRKIKAMQGITIRHLARITGISKSVIDRI